MSSETYKGAQLVPLSKKSEVPFIAPPVEAAPREGSLPLSFGQQLLWFFVQMFPESPIYNEPIMVQMCEPVDAQVLARTLTEITRRHEAWRTIFTTLDGQPVQRIQPPRSFHLPVIDLTSRPFAEREAEASRLSVDDARRPFDLREGPLVRALLIRLSETDTRLIVTAHHIVVDGVSFFNVFLPELSALYTAFSSGRPSPLPELPVQYADFAVWQRRWLTEEELGPKLAYWRAHMAGLTELCFRTDYERPRQLQGRGARAEVALSAELMVKLRELGHRAGATLFATLLSAWMTLLFRYTGQSDIVVGSAAAGRPRPDLGGLIGYFNNNLVLRTQVDGSLTFLSLVARVREVLKAAREHQDVPFDRLMTELRVERSLNKSPIYNHVFILMPPLSPLGESPRLHATRFDIGTAKVDLYLELHQRPSGLVGHIEYQAELFSPATIERMIGHFQALLEGVVRDPEQRLSELPILTATEERYLSIWQGPLVAPRPDAEVVSLEQLFEARAARSPEAIAVEHGGRRLTYEELNARANRLAHYLRSQGVGPDTLVGLCIERSFDAMVGILGVLKAGGAYVPLDPDYPSERLRFILEDADIKLLLTSKRTTSAVHQHRGATVLLDEDWASIGQHSADNPAPIATAAHLAYVIYTSGSTGRPKGVLVERRGLYYLARAQERMFGLGVGSRVLQFFSLSFDGSVWNFTMTWPVGATLVLPDQEALLAGPSLVQLLKGKDIHAVTVTPPVLMVTPHQDLPALHTLITGADTLPEELVMRWAPGRRLFNVYGPTETTSVSVVAECRAGEGKPSIGRPLEFVPVYILDEAMRPVPVGVPGELYIGGPGVARGYLNRADLSAAYFLSSPFSETAGTRLYKTGDRVKWRSDGSIDYLGRRDRQVKLRGMRVELEEIEAELGRHPAVQVVAVEVVDVPGDKHLVAYVVPRAGAPKELERALKTHLRTHVPEHMVPAAILALDHMPVNPNGKVDRARLPVPARERSATPANTSLEEAIAAVWRDVLDVDNIDVDAPFFEVGGNSLALARVEMQLSARLGVDIDVMELMQLPTIRQLAAHLATLPGLKGTFAPAEKVERAKAPSLERPEAVAIVGMAIRAPSVRDPEELWDVVSAGRETIQIFEKEALIAAGADPARVRRAEFVPAHGVLDDADRFDAALFGYTDADAALMDPQQRVFLECTYSALEHAGCDPARFQGQIGVFGGVGAPLHWLGPVTDALRSARSDFDNRRAHMLNAPDFLALRVAFKLGLRGPAITVQTACSTSLSAIHLARQSLLSGECDVALSGGVTLSTLSAADRGYLNAEGGAESADGHCRPFDADASGTVRSSGAAVVVMKRLSDAVADRDTIHAVMLGSAMNNDGAGKMGFTAPSEDGIAQVIQRAYEAAGVDPGSVQFIEAHGTGTRLGDPIEVRALTRAFRRWTEQRGFCALGSVKANLGHIDAAAGAVGLIKAALALSHEIIPPVAGFRAPNPLLDLPSTPFFVNDAPLPWPRTTSPRRAGVSALGIGGTNVHVVIEEGPLAEAPASTRPFQLLCVSARTETALAEVAWRLRDHLAKNRSLDLADVAHTLAVGRAHQTYRATLLCKDASEARGALAEGAPALSVVRSTPPGARAVAFLFPGHGVQHLKMGLEAHEAEPVYRTEIDRCFDLVRDEVGLDLRPLWLGQMPEGERRLDEAEWAQPLVFATEYALARQFMAWGARPAAMLGHSLGEYVAACIAGVLSLRDALALVVTRGRLADGTPPGSMLAVFADERTVEPYLSAGVGIATHAPGHVVLSGLPDGVEAARARLGSAGIETRSIRASRAGHSPLMRTIRAAYRRRVNEVELRPPAIPIVSNVTGRYLTAEQATSPDYWADHLCSAVRLTEGLGTLLDLDSPICIELGPGTTLGSLLKGHPRYGGGQVDVVGTLPDFRKRAESSHGALLRGLGRAWELGVEVDWQAFYAHEKRRRIPLPTYPFEGRRYTLGAAPALAIDALDARALALARELGVRGIDDYSGLRPRLEELCASLVLDFFARRLGVGVRRTRPVDALRREAGILPSFSCMLEVLVQTLERAGFASRTPTGEILLHAEHVGRSADISVRLRSDFPPSSGLIRLAEHCIGHYDEALTGATEPITIVYPNGTNAFFLSCMDEMGPPHWQVYVALASEAVLEIVARRRGQKTTILEVGAGHGSLTWPLSERLRGADVEYHFTDIGRSFLLRAEAEAAQRGLSWVKALRFDLNRPHEEQGIHGRYDIILGLDAVHVAVDLSATLRNLHDLLEPGGSLIFVELTRTETWHHLIGGLLPGYWDPIRARGMLWMDLARWEDLLRRAGFALVTTVPRNAARRATADYGLLIAERGLTAERPERLPEVKQPATNAAAQDAPAASGYSSNAALDDTEQLVQSLWKRLLGVSRVPLGASFFELGGDSLLAVQFLAELRLRTNREIKLRQFTAQPTVEGVATLLRHTETVSAAMPAAPGGVVIGLVEPPPVEVGRVASGAADCLVSLQSTGMKRPFFCVHPIGGGALCYAPLARALDPDRPFFGIQSPMLADRAARPGSVEEMAARYVDAIRQVQSSGPYLLGGWSFGGVVAAEMVRHLQRSGQDTAALVLLDVVASPSTGMELLRSVDQRLPALAMLPAVFAGFSSEAGDRGRPQSEDISRLSDALTMTMQSLVISDHHIAIWRHHTPIEIDVPAIHFVPKERPLLSTLLLSVGSHRLPIRSVSTVRVPGDHWSMLSGNHAHDLAARIKAALDAAEQRARPHRNTGDGGSPERDEASVRAYLQQFVQWMRERNGAALGAMFAEGVECVNVSTGESILIGSECMKEHYMRKMATLRGVSIQVHDWRVLVIAGGRVACAVGLVDSDQTFVQGGRSVSYRGARLSIVLEKQGDSWRAVHMHYSLPVGGPLDTIE